jgi:hypothetical protein
MYRFQIHPYEVLVPAKVEISNDLPMNNRHERPVIIAFSSGIQFTRCREVADDFVGTDKIDT